MLCRPAHIPQKPEGRLAASAKPDQPITAVSRWPKYNIMAPKQPDRLRDRRSVNLRYVRSNDQDRAGPSLAQGTEHPRTEISPALRLDRSGTVPDLGAPARIWSNGPNQTPTAVVGKTPLHPIEGAAIEFQRGKRADIPRQPLLEGAEPGKPGENNHGRAHRSNHRSVSELAGEGRVHRETGKTGCGRNARDSHPAGTAPPKSPHRPAAAACGSVRSAAQGRHPP